MRHRKIGKILSRTRAQRRALLRSLAQGLVAQGRITTTLGKAKALRPFVERLISLGRSPTLPHRRRLMQLVGNRRAVDKILVEFGPRYAQRSGGYTRIIKRAPRRGDASPRAVIEFV